MASPLLPDFVTSLPVDKLFWPGPSPATKLIPPCAPLVTKLSWPDIDYDKALLFFASPARTTTDIVLLASY
jgi:hypothetical protein